MCHHGSGDVCSGWLGHKTDPTQLLAVRLGLMTGRLHPDCADYTTTVPLFASGAEAAQHGCAQVHSPGARAQAAIDKITRVRARAGAPVTDTPHPDQARRWRHRRPPAHTAGMLHHTAQRPGLPPGGLERPGQG